VSRLPVYLRALHALAEAGTLTVSSETLASAAGVSAAKLRKDLCQLGSFGTRGVGYDVPLLVACISSALGLTRHWPVVLVGVGNLGQALAGYGGFASRGFRVAALLDVDPHRVGTEVAGVVVSPLAELEAVVAGLGGRVIGVIATPASAAQAVADRLVAAGVTSILNFAPVVLSVPAQVEVRKVDLALELQILSFHQARRPAPAPALTGVTA
jgi:redox-sensing transcriptional repressor